MTRKQYNWIWIILAVLPLIILIISYANLTDIGNLNLEAVLNRMGFTVEFDDIVELNHHKYVIYFTEPIKGSLDYIIYNTLGNMLPSSNNYFLGQYVAYLIRLEIIKVALNVFLMLPRICNSLMEKLIGGTKIE